MKKTSITLRAPNSVQRYYFFPTKDFCSTTSFHMKIYFILIQSKFILSMQWIRYQSTSFSFWEILHCAKNKWHYLLWWMDKHIDLDTVKTHINLPDNWGLGSLRESFGMSCCIPVTEFFEVPKRHFKKLKGKNKSCSGNFLFLFLKTLVVNIYCLSSLSSIWKLSRLEKSFYKKKKKITKMSKWKCEVLPSILEIPDSN